MVGVLPALGLLTASVPFAPMEAPTLRPLGIGDVIDRVFGLYRAHPVLFLVLAAIPNLLSILVSQGSQLIFPGAFVDFSQLAFQGDFTKFLEDTQRQSRAANAQQPLVPLVVLLISLVIASLGATTLTCAAAKLYLGKSTTVGESFAEGMRAVPRVALSLIVAFIVFLVVWLLIIFLSALPVAITRIGILVVPVFVATIVVPVALFVSFALVPTVSMLEGAGPISSIRRSWSLAGGNRWRLLGLLVLLLVLEIVLGILIGTVFLAAFFSESTVSRIVALLVSAVGTILWEPLPWATLAVFYYDLRVRKEAFDLRLAAEALPRPA